MKFFYRAGCMLTTDYYRLYFAVILFKVSKKDAKFEDVDLALFYKLYKRYSAQGLA